MPRVSFVTELSPCPPHGGSFIRSYNLIDSLCERHEVMLLAPQLDVPCALRQRVQHWCTLPPSPRDTGVRNLRKLYYLLRPYPEWTIHLQRICRQYRPDVIWFDYGHWGQYVPIVKQAGSQATIQGTHNNQSELTKQGLAPIPPYRAGYWQKLSRYWAERWHEHVLFRNFDFIVSVNEADRRYHARFVGDERSRVIPNFVNEAWYTADTRLSRRRNLVVMTGSFGAYQNRLGAEWLLSEVWPIVCRDYPDAQLMLVGRHSQDLSERADRWPNAICTGEVDSTTAYLRQAALSLAPIHHASGTRLKILESWACGTPVVSTTLGAEGLDLAMGECVVLADTAVEFAHAVVDLLVDEAKRDRLAQNGLAVLQRDYSFPVNAARVNQIIEDICNQAYGYGL